MGLQVCWESQWGSYKARGWLSRSHCASGATLVPEYVSHTKESYGNLMLKYYRKAQSQRVANPDKHVITSMEAQLSEPFPHPSQHRNLTST